MNASDIRSIDFVFKYWRDKTAGQTYHGGFVIVNYGLEDSRHISVPYQWGGHSMAEQNGWQAIWELCGMNSKSYAYTESTGLKRLPDGTKVVFRSIDRGYCTSRELSRWCNLPHMAFNG